MKNILIVGEALVDIYNNNTTAGGAPLNVACSLSKLKNNVLFLTSIGNDENGKLIIETLKKYKININYLSIVSKISTTKAIVKLNQNNDRNFEFKRGADAKLKFEKEILNGNKIDWVHFGSATAFLGDELEKTYYDIFQYCIDNNINFSFDPNFRDAFWITKNELNKFIKCSYNFIKKAKIIKLSEEELNILSVGNNITEKIIYISELNNNALICITQGKKGTTIFWKNKIQIIKSIESRNVIDTTGAGDAFISALVSDFINNKKELQNIKNTILYANEFAKNCIEYIGAISFLDCIKI